MKRLFKFKHPKTIIFFISIVLSYLVFTNKSALEVISRLNELNYIGIFIAGIMFPFGFLAPFSVGFFITSNPSNILTASIIGGLGALISNLIIFKIIRFSFIDEFNKIKHTKIIKEINHSIDKNISHKIKNYLLYIFAGIIIASPLPDEIGVTMLAGLTKIRQDIFLILSFILSTLGIYLIFLLS